MNRRIVVAGVVGTLALALSGCGLGGQTGDKPADQPTQQKSVSAADIKGEITFQTWSLKNEKFTPYFEDLVKQFEAKYPGTKVNWIDQPGEGYEDKVMQQATANQLPDVVNLPQGYAYQLAKVNKLVDLKAADEAALAAYTEGGLGAYQFEGVEGTYGYPWYLGTDLNWWNKKAFDDYGLDSSKLPTSRDELFAAAKTMAEKSGGKMPLVSSPPEVTDLVDSKDQIFKDGKFVFNSPEAEKVLQSYIDLYKAKAMPPEVLQANYLGNSQLYTQGKVAWTTGSGSFPVDLAKNAPTISKVTTFTKRWGTPPLFVQGLSVAKESKNPATALAFAQFASNNENQVEFVKIAQGFLPGTKEGNENPDSFTSVITEPEKKAAVDALADEMKTAQVLGPVQFTDAMKTYVDQQVTAAMRGDISAKEALDRAVKYCNDNLN